MSVYVMKDGTSIDKDGGIPEFMADKAGTDSTMLVKDAGSYYLDINAANCDWTVKVEEQQ